MLTPSQPTAQLREITRRHFFQSTGLGVGALALHQLVHPCHAVSKEPDSNPLASKPPMIAPRAKRIIYLHMAGSPSQLELFDYKPELTKLHMQDAPASFLEGKRFAFIKGVPKVLAAQTKFAQQGESGQWMSELLPQLAKVVDKISVIRTVNTDQFNHAPAQLFVHTGSPRLGGPSIGSWVTYGLGSENENLPGFVVLLSGGKTPDAGKSLWGSGFLPSVYQGVQCRTTGEPVLYLNNPKGIDRNLRRRMLDTVAEMNQAEFARNGDAETQTRIAQYELAYRMQMAVPEAMDLSREPQHILDLYGAQPGFVSKAESADDQRVI
jgi:AraC-like DNA-binding protein